MSIIQCGTLKKGPESFCCSQILQNCYQQNRRTKQRWIPLVLCKSMLLLIELPYANSG